MSEQSARSQLAEVPAPVWRTSGLEPGWEGERLYLSTSAADTRRARMLRAVTGLAAAVLGAGLLAVTPWSAALALAGLLWAASARLLHPKPVLSLHREALIPLQPEVAGPVIPCDQVRSIYGAYETQGWDARSVLFLALEDGTDRPVMILPGAGEQRPEAACRVLGALLGCPAFYTGAAGKQIECGGPRAALLS